MIDRRDPVPGHPLRATTNQDSADPRMKTPLIQALQSMFKRPHSVLELLLLGGFFLCTFVSPDLLATTPPGNGPAAVEADDSTVIMAVLFGLALVVLAALVVGGLVLWGKKQDDTKHMMSFCIKYLIDTQDETERCNAATALGDANEPGALLVLLDATSDENAEDSVREAAAAALSVMGQKYRKFRKVIKNLTSAVEDADHQKIIDILSSNFEGKGKKYVQTAYVISREYMRLGNYTDAREWIRVAAFRNRKNHTYGKQIRKLADTCNERLFGEGDRLFNTGYYHDAKAQYAVASHGLGDAEKKRFASYLREACVYCKLEDYQDADQALLQALQHHHETDSTLTLNKLLQKLLDQSESARLTEQEREQLNAQIDECVSDIMRKLTLATYFFTH